MPATSSVRVSVIVPVYNTGEHIEKLIETLRDQTLPQTEFEVIFSDDGSTDDTPARLDRLADEQENVTVLHLPNSGWPGRPRNAGIDIARGEYVLFVDHDDWLGLEALERMTDFGRANDADIVIGRYAGHRRGVARALFDKTYVNATLANAPIIDSLTPHKMFRTQFVRDKGLRFPEGRRRLEDHVFVVSAYFLAERISVLSDYHCYFHVSRDDRKNAGFQRIDPTGYYGNVREVVGIVLSHTEPGPLRDKLLRRTLRTEMLGRLSGASFLHQPQAYRTALFEQVRAIAAEHMPESVDAALPAPQRVAAWLVRQDRQGDLEAYVEQSVAYRADARLVDVAWTPAGELTVSVTAQLVDKLTGTPWAYARDGGRYLLPRPVGVHGEIPTDVVDCTDRVRSASVQIVLRRREDSEEWRPKTRSVNEVHEQNGAAWLTYQASATFDPRTVGGGRPLTDGVWDVFVTVSQAGWSGQARLGANRTEDASRGARPALLDGMRVLPYWTDPHGNLSLDVAASPTRLARHAVSEPATDGTTLRLRLALMTPESAPLAATLLLTGPGSAERPVEVTRTADGLAVSSELAGLNAGEWQATLRLAEHDLPIPGRLTVGADGLVSLAVGPKQPRPKPARPPRAGLLGKAARRAPRLARLARRASRMSRRLAHRLARR